MFVISVEQRQWVPECRMSSGWHTPFLMCSHSSVLCGCLLSLIYRCDLGTKAALCSVISSPKLISLIAFYCVYLSWTLAVFCLIKRHLHALFETINIQTKYHKKSSYVFALLCNSLLVVLRWEANCEWLKFGRQERGRDLVLSSSDKLQGELEEKQAVCSEEQCGIESCSADRPNPSAAGLSCALGCMNDADCLNSERFPFIYF